MVIQKQIGNEKRAERNGEFQFRRKIDRATERDGGERCEVRQPGCLARLNQEDRRDAIRDSRQNKDERRNHWEKFSCPARVAKPIRLRLLGCPPSIAAIDESLRSVAGLSPAGWRRNTDCAARPDRPASCRARSCLCRED